MYEYSIVAGSSKVGMDKTLTLGAAVDYMQDCEWFDIMNEPGISDYFEENGVGMVVIFRQLDLIRRPVLAERMRVKTWAYRCTRLLGFRNTMIYDEAGQVCVAGNSIGAFVETAQGRSTRVAQSLADAIYKGGKYEMEYLPRKISVPEGCEWTSHEAISIAKHHIDGNNHMNNAKYLEIAEDCLPDSFSWNRIRVEYKVPAKRGDILIPELLCGEAGHAENAKLVRLRCEAGEENAIVEFSRAE